VSFFWVSLIDIAACTVSSHNETLASQAQLSFCVSQLPNSLEPVCPFQCNPATSQIGLLDHIFRHANFCCLRWTPNTRAWVLDLVAAYFYDGLIAGKIEQRH